MFRMADSFSQGQRGGPHGSIRTLCGSQYQSGGIAPFVNTRGDAFSDPHPAVSQLGR
jgi:hypothetical protein